MTERYATWDEAEAGHAVIVERVRAMMTKHKNSGVAAFAGKAMGIGFGIGFLVASLKLLEIEPFGSADWVLVLAPFWATSIAISLLALVCAIALVATGALETDEKHE